MKDSQGFWLALTWLLSLSAAEISAPHKNKANVNSFIPKYPKKVELNGTFHVQGWRWHTLSMVREVNRLRILAENMSHLHMEPDVDRLKRAAEYVIEFNMAGLHRIERDLFFPWVRKKLRFSNDPSAVNSLSPTLDSLEASQAKLATCGSKLMNVLAIGSNSESEKERRNAIEEVALLSAQIVEHGRSMIQMEDSVLVPAVGKLVSESEQKTFNNKVIRNLGILDSRLHLVGMHEAVEELNDEAERLLFEKTIPALPQKMIPRWKRKLYESATCDL